MKIKIALLESNIRQYLVATILFILFNFHC